MSSIAHADDSDAQLCIANSLEVRSDEICAESVLSASEAAPGVSVINDDAVDRNLRLHTTISKQQNTSTAASNADTQRQPQMKSRSNIGSNQKSSYVATSVDADCIRHNIQSSCRRSTAEADVGDQRIFPAQKNVCHPDAVENNCASIPVIQNDIVKSSLQV